MRHIMDQLFVKCDDGSCCCISPRSMMIFISIINLIASVIDTQLSDVKPDFPTHRSGVLDQVSSLKILFVTVYQMANIILLVAAIVESAALVQVFVWYSLGFIVTSLIITIVEYVSKFKESNAAVTVEFIVEVIFLFVTCRCLPLVDMYRKQLDNHALLHY